MAKTLSELIADIDTYFPTNNAGGINAATLRARLKDIVQNEYVPAANILTVGGIPDSTTVLYGDNVWRSPPTAGQGATTGSGPTGSYITFNSTVASGSINYIDTIGASVSITLPTTPSAGNLISFRDAQGTWGISPMTLLPGSAKIESLSGSFVVDVADANFDLVWRGGAIGWGVVFNISNFTRSPISIRNGVGTAIGSALPLGVGRATANIGAGLAAGSSTALATYLPAVAATTTWSTTDKAPGITLSGGNLIATMASGTDPLVRANVARSAGYRFVEYTVNTVSASGDGIWLGLASSSAPLTGSRLGIDQTTGAAVSSGGYITGPGASNPLPNPIVAGDIISMAVWLDGSQVYFWQNGNWLGQVLALPSPSLYPAVSLGTVGDQVTANFGGSAFTYWTAVGAGSTSWNSAT
jgi:hypothetical protein